jgi:arylsulfatase A-like enzyme
LGYQDQIPWRYTHTLAEELAGGGYQTHCVGKTHSYDNLATDPHRQDLLKFWRQRMIEELAPRTQDGLSNGKRLIPGICLPHVRPALLQPTEES